MASGGPDSVAGSVRLAELPAGSLVEGVTAPKIPGAKSVTFDQWPKSLKDLAVETAKLAE